MSILDNDVLGSITVTSRNKMSGSVRIIGVGENNLSSSIITKHSREIKSNITIYNENVIDENGLNGNQIKARVEVPNRNNLQSSISIAPHNRMRIIAEIIEPPKTQTNLKKIKDTFVRSSTPTLNYSKSSNTFVGKNYQDEFRTLIKIDIDEIPKSNQIITSSELIIKKENYTQEVGKIDVYEILEPWVESNSTWKNIPKIGKLITSVSIPVNPSTIHIDILEKFKEWYYGVSANNGLMIKFSTISETDIYQFGTSKSVINSPTLSVEYYDESSTYSSDIYKLPSSISIQQNINSDLKSSLFINSYWNKDELIGSITIPRYDKDEDLLSKISVSNLQQNSILSEIIVSNPQIIGSAEIYNVKSLLSNIKVRELSSNDMTSSTAVRRNSKSDLRSSLIIESKNRDEDLNSFIAISKPQLVSNLRINIFNNLISNAKIRNKNTDNLPSSLVVSKPDLVGSLRVSNYNDMLSTISVKNSVTFRLVSKMIVSKPDLISCIAIYPTDSIQSNIKIINDYLESSITVRVNNNEDLNSNISVRNLSINKLKSSLSVLNNSNLKSSIAVRVNNNEDLNSNISVRNLSSSELESSLNVCNSSDLNSFIIISKPNLESTITVQPASSISNSILSSIRIINDYLESSLTVRSSNHKDLDSNITVRVLSASEIESSLNVFNGSDLAGSIIIVNNNNNDEAYVFIM